MKIEGKRTEEWIYHRMKDIGRSEQGNSKTADFVVRRIIQIWNGNIK